MSLQACQVTHTGLCFKFAGEKSPLAIENFNFLTRHGQSEDKNIVLIDLDLGFEAVSGFLVAHRHTCDIVIWSGSKQKRDCLVVLFCLGAKGFLDKSTATDQVLIKSLQCVWRGYMCFYDEFFEPANLPAKTLTSRELEVFNLVLLGCGTTKIARILKIGAKTVCVHKENIKNKIRYLKNFFPWSESERYFIPYDLME